MVAPGFTDIDPVEHIGSGVLIHHAGKEYVATALHVAEDCNFEPLIGTAFLWRPSTWETVGIDQANDVAVLERVGERDNNLTSSTLHYGFNRVTSGAMANAFGFPITKPPIQWSIMGGTGRPVPMAVSVLTYPAMGDIQYCGGYLNYGFSGGAIVAWAETHPTVIGIISEKGLTESGSWQDEHAGLVRFAHIRVVERIIGDSTGLTRDEFQAGKPSNQLSDRGPYTPSSLTTSQVVDGIIMMGRRKQP